MPAADGPIGRVEAVSLLAPWLNEPAILAVSGGPDSVALMGLAAASGAERPVVASVDHGLRAASRREAEDVAGQAAALGLRHRILAWTGPKPATRIQDAAREARYRLLGDLAAEMGIRRVLTAHTRDDQAETLVMRLAAGSGLAGLAAMEVESVRGALVLVRPFLALPKSRLVATCAAEGWSWIEDPSNTDPRFGRVAIRSLMPALAAHGLSADRLARLARRARRAEAALASAATEASRRLTATCEPGRVALDGRALMGEPDEIVLRVLAAAIGHVAPPAPVRLERLEALAERLRAAGGGAVRATLGGALVSLGHDGRLVVAAEPPRRGRRPQP